MAVVTELARAGLAIVVVVTATGCTLLSGASESGSGPAPAEPPISLADGSAPPALPRALRRFDGRPVIAARAVGAHDAAAACGYPAGEPHDGSVAGAWLSPAGLAVGYATTDGGSIACDAIWRDGRRRRCGIGTAHGIGLARVVAAGGAPSTCKNGGDTIGFTWIPLRRDAAWTLLDEGRFLVAYPSRGRTGVRVATSQRVGCCGLRTKLIYVDGRGRELGRTTYRAYAAG